jgi:hypothetical protein
MGKQIALLIFIVFTHGSSALAQDNNLLAKLAYENAETALTEKNLSEGLTELSKVDQLLGKLTPRSQYLRVQLWVMAAESNPGYLDSLIHQGKTYINLSKSFDIVEEKQMEVIRLVQKGEKDKEVYEKKAREESACKTYLQNLDVIAATHDPATINTLTGFDMNKGMFEQLKKAGRTTNRDVNYGDKHKTPQSLVYIHKGTYHSAPCYFYFNIISTSKPYHIKGLDAAVLDKVYTTTRDGAFQELQLGVLASDIQACISQVSAILGFKPDAHIEMDASNPLTQSPEWFWFFQDYTVSLSKGTGETSLQIVRHYPATGSMNLYAPFVPCKQIRSN